MPQITVTLVNPGDETSLRDIEQHAGCNTDRLGCRQQYLVFDDNNTRLVLTDASTFQTGQHVQV